MRLVVVGTGTDVGKTHVSACLLAHARTAGIRAAAYKPIATGVTDHCEDADRLAGALGIAPSPPTYAFREPVSPHRAAREEHRAIDLHVISDRALGMAARVDLLLVETAGGLFSPLADRTASTDDQARPLFDPAFRAPSNIDLVRALFPAVVLLVAPDRLGVLHDVSACLYAASAVGLVVSNIVLSQPAVSDSSTGTNAHEIEQIGLGRPLGVFPRAALDAPESRAMAASVWTSLVP